MTDIHDHVRDRQPGRLRSRVWDRSAVRTRWAAVGAAVAITLGAGGVGLVSATSPAEAVTFIPITPCRVMDTRPAPDTVGDKASPLGGGETHTVTAVGATGDCTEVPADATAVSLNVTALGATLPTFLTIWAADAAQPEASSLNPVPGAPPTPNAVTTELNGSGEFSIFNLQGSVDAIADINGYYVDHDHDDRYYTETEIDAVLPFAVSDEQFSLGELTTTLQTVASVEVAAPSDGDVTVNAQANVFHDTADGDVVCFILRSTDADPPFGTNIPGSLWFESEGPNSNDGTIAGTRGFEVVAGSTTVFELRCAENSDGGQLFLASVTAIFTPAATA